MHGKVVLTRRLDYSIGVALYARFWLSRGLTALAEETLFRWCRRPKQKQQFRAAVRESHIQTSRQMMVFCNPNARLDAAAATAKHA